MSNSKTKVWLIIGAVLILLGGLTFGGVMTMLDWNFSKLSTVEYETNRYTLIEDFSNISIVTNTADIKFVAAEKNEVSVTCHEQTNLKHTVCIENNSLVIKVNDSRNWYDYIGIGFDNTEIIVALPIGQYGDLSIESTTSIAVIAGELSFQSINVKGSTGDVECYASASKGISVKLTTGDILIGNLSSEFIDLSVSTGQIRAENVNCQKNMSIKVSTGKTYLSDVKCDKVLTTGSTGDVSLKNVIANEDIIIERTTGNVKFDSSDGKNISVKTDTGSVGGNLLSDKIFIIKTNTGRVSVPESNGEEKCAITTTTGNIIIEVK